MSQFSSSRNSKRGFQQITRDRGEVHDGHALISFEHDHGFANSRTSAKSHYQNFLNESSNREPQDSFYLQDIIKENEELRAQKNAYFSQLNKNEELLWKAREIISQAKHGIINWQEIYKDDGSNRNIFGFELDDNHRREIENSTPVLGGGITLEHTLRERVSHRNQPPPRIEDKQSEDQDRNLLMMQIKTLSSQNRILAEKNEYWNQFILKLTRLSGIDSQEPVSPELGADILMSMKKMLEKNSDLQARAFGLEQKVKILENQIIERYMNSSMIKETEFKVDNLEEGLQKLAQTPYILQKIEERFDSIQKGYNEKLQTIKSAIQRLYSEINKTCINIGCEDVFSSIEIDPFSQRIVGKKSSEFEVQEILRLLSPSYLLKPLLQKLINHIYQKSLECFSMKITKKIGALENKVSGLESLKHKANQGKRQKLQKYR